MPTGNVQPAEQEWRPGTEPSDPDVLRSDGAELSKVKAGRIYGQSTVSRGAHVEIYRGDL